MQTLTAMNSCNFFSITLTYQGTEDEKHHKDPAKNRLTRDVTIADRRHGNQGQIHTFPIC